MTVCVISQPRLFPGLHYLHRMMVSDIFVILDTVQFNPRHEENRAKLKSSNGPQWMTVPVRKRSRDQLIRDTSIDNNQAWKRKAIKTLDRLYRKAKYYRVYERKIETILGGSYKTILEIDIASWKPALELLKIECRFVYASELPLEGKGQQLLLNICKYLGAETYLSGAFGRKYLEIEGFMAENVQVKFHEYEYPVYPQRFGEFVPFLSYLDMLLNAGLDRNKVLEGGKME